MADQVAILLCTYQGQAFLADQLASLGAQTHQNWTLFISDDGSRDGTLALIDDFRQKWGESRVHLLAGPRQGFVANFLSLTCHPEVRADYYAYADQDDIWDADKLERALAWLRTVDPSRPALYCSRTRLIDGVGQPIGESPQFNRSPAFANALVQNIAGGNTMVFNNPAMALMRTVGPQADVAAHDWLTYQVISGCGGEVHYDHRPSLQYRQHDGNLIGANRSFSARLSRVRQLAQGRLRDWNTRNLRALEPLHDHLSEDSRRRLNRFSQARQASLPGRISGLYRSGVYRQTTLGNLGLLAAAIFNKI